MINSDMRLYNYYLIGEPDAYGQPQMPAKDAAANGQIKMAAYTTSQGIQDSAAYINAVYVGITHDEGVNEKYLIEVDGQRLKVLYVQPKGRFKQVFMARM